MKDLPFNRCLSGCLSVPLVIYVCLTAEQFIDSSNVHIHLTHPMTLRDFSTLFPTSSSGLSIYHAGGKHFSLPLVMLCSDPLLNLSTLFFPPTHSRWHIYRRKQAEAGHLSYFLEMPLLICPCAIIM